MLWTLAVLAAHGQSTDWLVGDNQAYATINDVVGLVEPGDRIVLDGGSYPPAVLQNLDRIEVVAAEDAFFDVEIEATAGGPALVIDNCTDITVRDLRLDGAGVHRGLEVDRSTLTLENVEVTNGFDAVMENGGGILVGPDANVTITDSQVHNCDIDGVGGGIYALGQLTVSATRFDQSIATEGGAIYCGKDATCIVTDSEFRRNFAAIGGAFVGRDTTRVDLIRNGFCDNNTYVGAVTLGGRGGAVALAQSTGTLRNNLFRRNDAVTHGGAMWVYRTNATLTNNTFIDNNADEQGGALHLEGLFARGTLTNNLFDRNRSDADDGVAATITYANDVNPSQTEGSHNLFWDDEEVDLQNGLVLDDPVTGNPQVSPDSACHPQGWLPQEPGPAIDAGASDIIDPDGSRSDVGSSGGPDAYRDRDNDGVLDGSTPDRDCDDRLLTVFPGANEICNEIDDDCDGDVDADDDDLVDGIERFADADGDGFGDGDLPVVVCVDAPGVSATADDCDDERAAVFPGAEEVCNQRDDDCDGDVDEGLRCAGADADPTGDEPPFVGSFRGARCDHTGLPVLSPLLLGWLVALRRRRRR